MVFFGRVCNVRNTASHLYLMSSRTVSFLFNLKFYLVINGINGSKSCLKRVHPDTENGGIKKLIKIKPDILTESPKYWTVIFF